MRNIHRRCGYGNLTPYGFRIMGRRKIIGKKIDWSESNLHDRKILLEVQEEKKQENLKLTQQNNVFCIKKKPVKNENFNKNQNLISPQQFQLNKSVNKSRYTNEGLETKVTQSIMAMRLLRTSLWLELKYA